MTSSDSAICVLEPHKLLQVHVSRGIVTKCVKGLSVTYIENLVQSQCSVSQDIFH